MKFLTCFYLILLEEREKEELYNELISANVSKNCVFTFCRLDRFHVVVFDVIGFGNFPVFLMSAFGGQSHQFCSFANLIEFVRFD